MSYISLYRKYRPHKFKEVVGQEVVVKILKNSIINNKIGHAYIFSGPRGTGKTSIAKIFARAVNCLDNQDGDICEKCANCTNDIDDEIDIIEIDAASNNGVDEIREIRNNVKMMPSNLKYRIYIIDEVHMLSTSAFNALLKTLEEPPSHAIFILATTEINKIPATVISRCQKFDFKKISESDIINRLKYILSEENKTLEDNIIKLIAKLSDGGLRDAINLLDQILSLNKDVVEEKDVYDLIGEIDLNNVFDLLKYITSGNIKEVIKIINNYYDEGKNFSKICEKLEYLIKDILIYNNTDNYFDKEYENKLFEFSKIDSTLFIKMSQDLFDLNYDLKRSNNQKIVSEIYFLKMTLNFNTGDKTEEKELIKETTEIVNKTVNNSNENEKIEQEILLENKKIIVNNCLYEANKQLKIDFTKQFEKIKEYETDKKYNMLSNLLSKSIPEVVGNNNVLFTFKNNFEVVLFEKNTEKIEKFIELIYNKKYTVVSVSNEEWNEIRTKYINDIKNGVKYEYMELKKMPRKNKKNTELENSIKDIFGEEYIKED